MAEDNGTEKQEGIWIKLTLDPKTLMLRIDGHVPNTDVALDMLSRAVRKTTWDWEKNQAAAEFRQEAENLRVQQMLGQQKRS